MAAIERFFARGSSYSIDCFPKGLETPTPHHVVLLHARCFKGKPLVVLWCLLRLLYLSLDQCKRSLVVARGSLSSNTSSLPIERPWNTNGCPTGCVTNIPYYCEASCSYITTHQHLYPCRSYRAASVNAFLIIACALIILVALFQQLELAPSHQAIICCSENVDSVYSQITCQPER